MRFTRRSTWPCAALIALSLAASPAQGFAHLWRFAEIYTSPDGAVQFIELFTAAPAERFLITAMLTSSSNTFRFPSNVAGSTANRSLLLATPGFESLPGGVAPDFTIPSNFFSLGGDTLTFFAFGPVDTLTFTAPQLPTNGVLSLDANTLQEGINSPRNFAGFTGSVNVPEPSTGAFAAAGLACLARWRRRKARTALR